MVSPTDDLTNGLKLILPTRQHLGSVFYILSFEENTVFEIIVQMIILCLEWLMQTHQQFVSLSRTTPTSTEIAIISYQLMPDDVSGCVSTKNVNPWDDVRNKVGVHTKISLSP